MVNKYKKIRDLYGLSGAGMSKVLGIGVNQWRLYEAGLEPVGSYMRLAQVARDPRSMLKLVRENERALRYAEVGLGNKRYDILVRRCEEILAGYEEMRENDYKLWVDGLYNE